VAAIKQGDATTNQNSVSAVGGTWRRRAIAEERMGGAFCNCLAAANKKHNNQPKKSDLDGREMGCDKSTMEGAGGA